MIDNLKEKTGKALEEWIKIIKTKNFQKHGEIMNFLKKEFGVTHGFANTIAHKARESDAGSIDNDTLIKDQYNEKEDLFILYTNIIKQVKSFGDDIEISPKKAYVSLRRKKQFALIQPSTKTRLDVGINIKGKDSEGILEKSGSWNSMVSHRVRIEDSSQVNDNLFEWLREAYETS